MCGMQQSMSYNNNYFPEGTDANYLTDELSDKLEQ